MWLKAIYIDQNSISTEILVAIIGKEFVIKSTDLKLELEKWPLSSITQSPADVNNNIILQWLPKTSRVVIKDDQNLRAMSWRKKLPDSLDRSHLSGGAIWISLFCLLGVAYLFTLPIVANWVPWSFESYLFENFQPYSESQYCLPRKDSSGRSNFDIITKRIYPIYPDDHKFPLQIEIVRDDQVNAFATPGGKIFVLKGLLKEAHSAEEIAGILAHEIEHIKKRHVTQAILQRAIPAIFTAVFLGGSDGGTGSVLEFFMHTEFTKANEHAADLGGLQRLKDAKVSPAGAAQFFKRMSEKNVIPDIISDHPSDESRMKLFEADIPSDLSPILNSEQWDKLKSICD